MTHDALPDSQRIRDLFLSDHRRLNELLENLIGAFEADDREDIQKLWSELERGLLAHLEAEERFMIPALGRSSPDDAQAILGEHDRIRARMAEIGAGIDLHVVRLRAARAFIMELQRHAEREDEILYRWSDAHLGETERTSLFDGFAKRIGRTGKEVLSAFDPPRDR